MDDQRLHLLEKEKISKAINIMALPAIVGFMVMAIYNVVDTIFVARLGTDATSATQVVMPLTMMVTALGLGFGIGGGSYLSRLLGMKKIERAGELSVVTLVSGIVSGIVFTILMSIYLEPLLVFFGADEGIMDFSVGYGRYIVLGSAFVMGNMAMNNLLRAEGSGKLSMLGMAAGSVLNILLDPLFIFVFGWGIEGAAIATSLSQGVTFAVLLGYYLKGKSVITLSWSRFKPDRTMFAEIGKVGVPTFARQLLFSVAIAYLNQGAMLHGGPSLLAAVGIVFKLMMIPTFVVFGIGQGFQPVLGYNFGAGNKERVIEATRYTFFLALGMSVVLGILAAVFSSSILSIFRPEADVLGYAVEGIKLSAIAIALMSVSNTIGIFYQAIGRGKESMVLSVARQGLFFLPAIFLLPLYFGGYGILAAQLAADVLTLGLSALLMMKYFSTQQLDKDLVAQAA